MPGRVGASAGGFPWKLLTMAGLASIAALAVIVAALYFATDLFRSDDSVNPGDSGNPGGNATIEGYFTRQDLVDPSLGSAWYFDPATGLATYYAYWEPGTCDFFEPGTGPYSVVGGGLVLNGTWQATLSGDGRSFVLDLPGMWSGDDSEGVAGPNMTVVNGPSGTYVASSGCPAP